MVRQKSKSDLYIDDIVDKLKKHQASVFVGAGFSFNANRIDGSDSHMSSWLELADLFCNKIGNDSKSKDIRYENPLELAQEVEVLYGKPYLNSLIRDTLDDDSYEPGLAHKILVSLPWNDIFTTNYDTLLEKAYLSDTRRNYKIINNKNDLLYSGGIPRIVKLHGSFPSYEPFIISEEDYRRYPIDNAAFVNTVQQSLLENLMVLIGFSGNDPNFKKWIGWIHDNLGEKKSPKIYMIVPDSTSVNISILSSKNIEVIDLKDTVYGDASKRLSIENFLVAISDRLSQKKQFYYWPVIDSNVRDFKKLSNDNLLSYLKNLHKNYPGWITVKVGYLPLVDPIIQDICSLIFNKTIESQSNNNLVEICEEFVWLCDVSGYIANYKVLHCLLEYLKKNEYNYSKKSITNIKLYILKCYRVNGDSDWNKLYEELKWIKEKENKSADSYISLCYEYAMQMLYSFNWNVLESSVNLIPDNLTKPEFIIKKIGLLSILGKFDEALILLKNTLAYVRKVLLFTDRSNSQVYNRFSSLNSTLISQYEYIQHANLFFSSNNKNNEGNKEDLEKEDNIKYYVWSLENDKFANMFSSSYSPRPLREEKTCFDLDLIINQRHFGIDYECVYSMQFVLFRENTGHPFSIGYLSDKKGLLGAISRLNWIATRTPFVNAIVSFDTKAIDIAFSRKELAYLNCDFINRLCDDLISLLKQLVESEGIKDNDKIKKNSVLELSLDVIFESISRLTVKADEKIFSKIIEILLSITNKLKAFNEVKLVRSMQLSNGYKNLIKRTISYMPYRLLEEKFEIFWRFDFNLSFDLDVFFYLQQRVSREKRKYKLDPLNKKLVYDLINQSLTSDNKATALSRLLCICRMYKLDKKLKGKMSNIIWGKNIQSSFICLPELVCFSSIVSIDFPHVIDECTIRKLTRNYLFREYRAFFKNQNMAYLRALLDDADYFVEKFLLSLHEVLVLFKVAITFINIFREKSKSGALEFTIFSLSSLNMIDSILGKALLKNGFVKKVNSELSDLIDKIIFSLDFLSLPYSLLSWISFLQKNNHKRQFERLFNSYLHEDVSCINNANQSLYLLNSHGYKIDDSVIDLLVNTVITATHYNIVEFVNGVSFLINNGLLNKDRVLIVADSLSKIEKFSIIDVSDSNDTVIQKINLRKAGCYMAKSIESWCKSNYIEVPKSVMNWKVNIGNNPEEFAEIRLVWDSV